MVKFAKFSKKSAKISAIFNENFAIRERCKGVHCVDLGESFPTSIYLQKSASIQPRTSLVKFARSPRTDPPGGGAPRQHSRAAASQSGRAGAPAKSVHSPKIRCARILSAASGASRRTALRWQVTFRPCGILPPSGNACPCKASLLTLVPLTAGFRNIGWRQEASFRITKYRTWQNSKSCFSQEGSSISGYALCREANFVAYRGHRKVIRDNL